MADPFSAVAAGFNVADAGVKLSTSLYTYAETARQADQAIKDIARDVALTASVIRQLKFLIDQDIGLIDDAARKTADEVVSGCETVFSEIESAIEKTTTRNSEGEIVVSRLQKLKWPLKQPRVTMMQAKLERSKLLVLVILNIFHYAQRLATEQRGTSREDEEYQIIAQLIQKNQDLQAKYESLARRFSDTTPLLKNKTTPSPVIQRLDSLKIATEGKNEGVAGPKHDDQSCLCGAHPDSQRGNPHQAQSFHITRTDLTTCMLEVEDFLHLVRRAQSSLIHLGAARGQMCNNVLIEFWKGVRKFDRHFPLASTLHQVEDTRLRRDDVKINLGSPADLWDTLKKTDSLSGNSPEFSSALASRISRSSRTSPDRGSGKSPDSSPPPSPKGVNRRRTGEDYRYCGRHSNAWLFNGFSIHEQVKKGFATSTMN